MRIAVVGSGLAGLAAAWHLGARHEVTLLERAPRTGMDAHGVDLPDGGRVDVPLRVLHAPYYAALLDLYAQAGVETVPVDYAASFSNRDGATYFAYRNVRVAGRTLSLPRLRPLAGGAARRIVRDAVRFDRRGREDLARGDAPGSLGDYLARGGLSADFREGLLVPLLAGVGTCSHARVRAYPARVVLDYLTRGGRAWGARRAAHPTREVARRLRARVAHERLAARVAWVEPAGPDGAGPAGGALLAEEGGAAERFDHVVLATPADEARRLLRRATPAEAAALEAFEYDHSRVVVHRDPGLMPRRRRDWAPVNFFVAPGDAAPTATIWLNAVVPALRGAPPVFQTWNPEREPSPALTLHAVELARPVVGAASVDAWGALAALDRDPARRVWLCGSYAAPGVPLLESAAASALRVARAIEGQRGAGAG